MLKQRVLTALALLLVFGFAVWHPFKQIFPGFTLAVMVIAAWEWAQLNQYAPKTSLAVGGLFGIVGLGTWYFSWLSLHTLWLWAVTGGVWVLLAIYFLRAGVTAWLAVPRFVRLCGGLVVLWVAWLAIVQAKGMGLHFLFSVLVLVWGADVFAYAAGRVWGGRFFQRRLAPSISPGKTWEGVCGAVLGVVLLVLAWLFLESVGRTSLDPSPGSFYARLAFVAPGLMVLAIVFLVGMSIVGDLLESLFKRAAGVKDSSTLLPGHGGVLDRIDALLPVLPWVMLLLYWL